MIRKNKNTKILPSVIILTYNEEIHIGRCIKSVLKIADKIYIIDSYSSDKTLKICKKFGNKIKIYQHKYINHATQMNWAIKKIPKNLIVSASCHTQEEISIAEHLNLNFIVLSAIKKTISHPDMKPIGWDKFQKIVNKVNIPIYALGGLGTKNYEVALDNGAIGIASQRLIWQ